MLAAEEGRRVRGEPAENDVGGVDDQPLALGFASLGGVRARHNSAAFLIRTEMFVNPAPGWFSGRGPVEHASGGLTFAVRGQQGAGTKDLSYGIRMPSPKALATGMAAPLSR